MGSVKSERIKASIHQFIVNLQQMNARGKVPLAVGWYHKISLETQVACEFL